jgi:peptidyl-prolyl cis-trans isomerase SurA
MIKRMKEILLISLFLSFFINYAEAATDKIVAIVNNSVITQSELDNKLAAEKQSAEHVGTEHLTAAQLRQQVLDQLIDRELQLQIAEHNGLKVSDQEVTDAITSIVQRNKMTLARLQQELLKRGMKYQSFRKKIHDDIVLGRLAQQAVGKKITVSEEDVDAFLRSKAGSMRMSVPNIADKEYHLLDVLVPTTANPGDKDYIEAKKAVTEVLEQLRKGGVIEEIVKNVTVAGKPLVGSDLGWRSSDSLPEVFKTILPKLKLRDAAGPIIAPNGMHIIILLETRNIAGQKQVAPQQMTRDEAREDVYRQKMEKALQPWLRQLRATAYVKIMTND